MSRLINRTKLPLQVKCHGEWAGQCWPSDAHVCSVSPMGEGRVFVAAEIPATHDRADQQAFLEINLEHVGEGSLPLGTHTQTVNFSVEQGADVFGETIMLTIEPPRKKEDGPPFAAECNLEVNVAVTALKITVSDMADTMLRDYRNWPHPQEQLSGNLCTVEILRMNFDCTATSGERGLRLTAGCAADGTFDIIVADESQQAAARAPVLELSECSLRATMAKAASSMGAPSPPWFISVDSSLTQAQGLIDDVFVLKAAVLQEIFSGYHNQISGGSPPPHKFIQALRAEGQHPEIDYVFPALTLTGKGGGKIVLRRLQFDRKTDWVLPKLSVFSRIPQGPIVVDGWEINPIRLQSFGGNTNSLLQRIKQQLLDTLGTKKLAVIMAGWHQRHVAVSVGRKFVHDKAAEDPVGFSVKGTAAVAAVATLGPLAAVGLAGKAIAVKATAKKVSDGTYVDRAKEVSGARKDEGYHVGDLSTGVVATVVDGVFDGSLTARGKKARGGSAVDDYQLGDKVLGAAAMVSGVATGIFGSSKPARCA